MSDVTLQFRSTVTGDDGGWTSSAFNNSAPQHLVGNYNSTQYHAFYLFKNTVIPKGAVIVSAYMRYAQNTPGGTSVLNIYANDTTTPVAPTNVSEANALALTSAVAWTSISTVNVTNDIKNIIQTLVDKANWDIGKNIMIVLRDNGSATGNYKHISTIDNGAVTQPVLEVTWTLPSDWTLKNSGVSADDGQGMGFTYGSAATTVRVGWNGTAIWSFFRFPSVAITNANTINHAYLILTVQTAGSVCKTTAHLNDEDTAVAPTNDSTLGAKVVTAGVAWNDPFRLAERIQTSPDLKTDLQGIVNRAGWVSGNAAMVILKGVTDPAYNAALVYAYDNGSKYPLLLIHAPTTLAITSFDPIVGHVGTEVTITGDGFVSQPTVRFHNGVTAVVDSYTRTSIVTSVPAGAITGKITVDI